MGGEAEPDSETVLRASLPHGTQLLLVVLLGAAGVVLLGEDDAAGSSGVGGKSVCRMKVAGTMAVGLKLFEMGPFEGEASLASSRW